MWHREISCCWWHCYQNSTSRLSCSTFNRLPCRASGKAICSGSATQVGNQDATAGSWLQFGSDLAIVAIWEVNQQMRRFPSLFPTLSLSLILSSSVCTYVCDPDFQIHNVLKDTLFSQCYTEYGSRCLKLLPIPWMDSISFFQNLFHSIATNW